MERRTNLDYLIKVAILGAIAGAIMIMKFNIPIFPFFLTIDFSDVPAVVGAIIMGPIAGILIQAVKIVANLLIGGSLTFGVGELANFVSGISFVIPLGLFYKKMPELKGVIIGCILGAVSMTVVMSLSNYFFFIPLFAKAMSAQVQDFVNVASEVPFLGSRINDLKDLILFNFVPFNMIKGLSIMVITLLSYKFIIPPLQRMQRR